MTRRKGLVLDANILIRAVFGRRVRELLEAYEDQVGFYSPDVCFEDARKYIPDVSKRRGIDPSVGLTVLEEVSDIVESVDRSLYEEYEKVARERVLPRDPDDWPIVSVALLLGFSNLDRGSRFLW
jgi:predicted nucleic acid-binding protein